MKPGSWIGIGLTIALAAAGVVWLLWDSTPSAPVVAVSTPGVQSRPGPERGTSPAVPHHAPIRPRAFQDADRSSETRGEPSAVVVDDAPASVTFRLTDRAGDPIAQARVLADGRVSAPTGEDGITKLGVLPGTRSIVGGAPGFRIEGFPLPEKLPETMDLQLVPASVLVVRVRHQEAPELLRGLRMCVSYDVDPVAAAADSSSDFGDVRIARPAGSEGARRQGPGGAIFGTQTHCYEVLAGQDVTVSGFKEGDEIKARVQDAYGHVLIEQAVRLGAEETKAIELVIHSRPASFRGTVVGDQGQPLANAEVWVGTGAFREPVRCDSGGRFEIADVFESAPTLLITAAGHVARIVRAEGLTASSSVRLERAREITVHLLHGSSGEWAGRVVLELAGGETHTADQRSPDLFQFGAVPRRAGTIRVTGPKSTTSVPIGAEDTRVDIPKPE